MAKDTQEIDFAVLQDLLRMAAQIYAFGLEVDDKNTEPLRFRRRHLQDLDASWFHDSLYADTELVELHAALYRHLESPSHAILLTGPAGSGKTSLLSAVLRDLRNSPDFDVTYLNIAPEEPEIRSAVKVPPDDSTFPECFGRAIRDQIIEQAFPNDERAWDRFWAWLLTTEDSAASLASLRIARKKAKGLLEVNGQKPNFKDTEDVFKHIQSNDKWAGEVVTLFENLATTRHALVFLNTDHPNKRQVVLFDNIDRFTLEYQIALLQLAIDCQTPLSDRVVMLVSARTESFMRWRDDRLNPGGDPFASVTMEDSHITLGDPYTETSSARYTNHTSEVLGNRNTECRTVIRAALPLMSLSDDEHKLYLSFIENDLPRLSDAITSALNHANINTLTNLSLRKTNLIFIAFLQSLFGMLKGIEGERKKELVESLITKPDVEHLSTLFYMWMRQRNTSILPSVGNTFKTNLHAMAHCDFHQAASTDHFVLLALLNLMPDHRKPPYDLSEPHRYPTRRHLVEVVQNLGFNDIDQAIKGITSRPAKRVQYIFVVKHGDTADADHLKLTPLGYSFLTDVYSRVGYVWGGILESRHISYRDINSRARIATYFRHCVSLMKRSVALLGLARQTLLPDHSNDWMDYYMQHFTVLGEFQTAKIIEQAHYFYRRPWTRLGYAVDEDGKEIERYQANLNYNWEQVRDHVQTPFLRLSEHYRGIIMDIIGGADTVEADWAEIDAMVKKSHQKGPWGIGR